MNKAVLISIRPEWCKLIASGEKTIEVRKTHPNKEPPFKCYIYESRGDQRFGNESYNSVKKGNGRGKVIGEFVCNGVLEYKYPSCYNENEASGFLRWGSCLTEKEIWQYGLGQTLWGWHISDLKIYDTYKEIRDFRLWYPTTIWENGYPMPSHAIKRPPQSWVYVEEVQ